MFVKLGVAITETAPIRPVFKRACGDKNATFREKIYYPVRKGENKNERKKLLFNI